MARFIRGRVAVERRQHSLEHGDQRSAARRRVLPRGRRLRQSLLELWQAALHLAEIDRQPSGLHDGLVVARRTQQAIQHAGRFFFVAGAQQQADQRQRRGGAGAVRDRVAVRGDGQRVRAGARLDVADALQRLGVGARGRRGSVLQRPRRIGARERDVGDLQVGVARAPGSQPCDVGQPCHRFVELAGSLEQLHERERRLDGDITGGGVLRAVAKPHQQLPKRRNRRGRVAVSLLRLGEEQRGLEVVGLGARVFAQLPNLRVQAAAPLPPSSPSSRTRASRRTAPCCASPRRLSRAASASTWFHSATASVTFRWRSKICASRRCGSMPLGSSAWARFASVVASPVRSCSSSTSASRRCPADGGRTRSRSDAQVRRASSFLPS